MSRRLAPILLLALTACAPTVRAVEQRTEGWLVPTAGSNTSAMLLAPVDGGFLLIDLGWSGAEAELDHALDALDADPSDVRAVLVTHAHRDHVAAWPLVAHATFYMAVAEADLFLGRSPPEAGLVRLAHRLKPAPRPEPGEVEVRTFTGDTILAFGSDTVRAFVVPGHTPGSTAYLFRGVLFVGDALAADPFGGLRPASRIYSDDREQADRSIRRLWPRLDGLGVRFVCTAHGRCVAYDDVRPDPPGAAKPNSDSPIPDTARPRPAGTVSS